jgi:hypothetical protein
MDAADKHIDLGDSSFEHFYMTPLAMSDRLDRLDLLCQYRDARDRAEESLASAKATHKEVVAQIELKERETYRELRNNAQEASGICIERKDYKAGMVEFVLVETGQVVDSRPLTEDERQMALGENQKE